MSQSNPTKYKFPGKIFLEILLLITGDGGSRGETLSNISSEGPSEKHGRTAKSFQSVLYKMEYIL